MITVQKINVAIAGHEIIRDISFDILPGRFTVVIGVNGAGKSTLLNTLSGRNKRFDGRILWDKLPLHQMDIKILARRRAVLSQQFSPGFPMKVYDLVEMGMMAINEKVSPGDKKNKILQALNEVGMLRYKDRMFDTLSGGEQKRVLLAKCFVQLSDSDHHIKYLFLDEPTASIDIHHSYKILQLVKEKCHRENYGVFAIFHDLNLAAQFADQVLLLKSGELVYSGSPDQMFQPDILQSVLGINSIVQPHPILGCPHITTLPL
ncbi:ATP-binding cassette domain-containing protein [Membranihabitans marinus]|uniref:ATP-binding cassette domain-containing protein n=1 Tax=Membranihabitans marinus TaxID=1227546 RepID=UPI001F0009CA|nr:ATP-binding cassette domain-containing protein [Membranihabitans marinus]